MKDCTDNKVNKFYIELLVCLIFLIFIVFISICTGRYKISVQNIVKFISFQDLDEVSYRVIKLLRIPRILVAILVGAALSVSGAIYQSVFNNKLVSPDLLGVSSGASVGACLGILLGFQAFFINITALLFGFSAVFLTMILSKLFRNKGNVILLLCGLATSGFMSSLVGLMKYLADDDRKLAEMTFWLLGDISAVAIKDFYFRYISFYIC